ncbi:MAG: hypothetical protein AAGH64_02525 [Planctomycetota bacterium]
MKAGASPPPAARSQPSPPPTPAPASPARQPRAEAPAPKAHAPETRKTTQPADLWPALLERASGRTADRTALEALSLVECKDGALTLRVVDRASVALVKNRIAWIRDQASDLAGADVRVDVRGIEEDRARAQDNDPALAHRAMQNPVVRQAADLFDARVAGVRPRNDHGTESKE